MEKASQSFTFSQNLTDSEALDRILGNQEKQLPRTPRPQGFQPFGTRGVAHAERSLRFCETRTGAGAGRPGNKTEVHTPWISPCSTCRQ